MADQNIDTNYQLKQGESVSDYTKRVAAYNAGKSINSSMLGHSPINLNRPSYNDYSGLFANGNATIGANANTFAQGQPNNTGNNLEDLFKQYLGSNSAPPSATDLYSSLYKTSGLDAANADLLSKQKATASARSAFDAINAQIQGLTAEGQAMNLRQEGRLAPVSAITGQQAENNRQTAIKAIPLQIQALTAQAKIASAQGDEQLAQGIVQQAQSHLDTVYKLQLQDAETKYNYQKDLRDKVYEFATAQEKATLDKQQHADDQAFDLQKLSIQNDYTTQQKRLSESLSNSNSGDSAAFNQLSGAKGQDGYTDPNLYAKLRAASKLSPTEFDNRYGYLVNPSSTARLGISNTSANGKQFGTPTATDISSLYTLLGQHPNESSSVDQQRLQTDPQYFYWVLSQLQGT